MNTPMLYIQCYERNCVTEKHPTCLNMNIFILLFVKSLEHLWGVCELHADSSFFVTFLRHVRISDTSTAKRRMHSEGDGL